MVTEPHFQLTTKDHAILQTMLERYKGSRGPYLQLLERKVRDSTIFFSDDIPPEVVTLNTRLTCLIDGVRTDPFIIVHGEDGNLPPFALAIHTLRGLALLGLAEGDAITVEPGSDTSETLTVENILSQPEAEARIGSDHALSDQGNGAASTANVIAFPRAIRAIPADPDDDDPGPRAA